MGAKDLGGKFSGRLGGNLPSKNIVMRNSMKIFGSSKSSDGQEDLHELYISSTPEELKSLGDFLVMMAESMESSAESFGHGHFKDYFNSRDLETDIIVFKESS